MPEDYTPPTDAELAEIEGDITGRFYRPAEIRRVARALREARAATKREMDTHRAMCSTLNATLARIAALEADAACPCCKNGEIDGRVCTECKGKASCRVAYETVRVINRRLETDLAALEADKRRLEADKRRLDWLEAHGAYVYFDDPSWHIKARNSIDRAIAAINATKETPANAG